MRIGSIIIFHLRKLWKAKFSILCNVIFLVGLQGQFDIDHSWEWKGWFTHTTQAQERKNARLCLCLHRHQQYYMTQYEELGFSQLTQMKDDYSTNSHYHYTFLFKRLWEFTFWTWEWNCKQSIQYTNWKVSPMQLSQPKSELALEMKFYLDFHRVYMAGDERWPTGTSDMFPVMPGSPIPLVWRRGPA